MKFRVRLLGTLLLSAFPIFAFAEAELNMLCSGNVEWCELMKTRYERDAKVKVNMTRKSSGDALTQVRADAAAPKFDVWWAGSGDPHLEAGKDALTESYKSPSLNLLHLWAVKQGVLTYHRTVGIYLGILAVGYNEDVMKAKKLPVPRCWRDLANPIYKDQIQIANPNSSGTAYNFLATLVQVMGEEPAFRYFGELHKNVAQYTKGGAAPAEAAAKGEVAIGISFAHDLTKQVVKGAPLKLMTPCEGTGYEVGSMSIIKGAKNMDQAKHFYDWALRAEVQGWGPEVNEYATPANKQAPIPKFGLSLDKVRLIGYDQAKYGSGDVRRRLLKRWTDEVFSKQK